jgi:hypothetical protein
MEEKINEYFLWNGQYLPDYMVHSPEDSYLHTCCCQKLRSPIFDVLNLEVTIFHATFIWKTINKSMPVFMESEYMACVHTHID